MLDLVLPAALLAIAVAAPALVALTLVLVVSLIIVSRTGDTAGLQHLAAVIASLRGLFGRRH